MHHLRPDFYLASSEGYGMLGPRRCYRIKRLAGDWRDDYLLVRVDPPFVGQLYGFGGRDIYQVILATRFVGDSLFPVAQWPVFVHVALSLVPDAETRSVIHQPELFEIGWGEVYATEIDARNKTM